MGNTMSYPKIARVHIPLHLLAVWFTELMFEGPYIPKAKYWTYRDRQYWEITDIRSDGRYPCYGRGDLIDMNAIVTIHY